MELSEKYKALTAAHMAAVDYAAAQELGPQLNFSRTKDGCYHIHSEDDNDRLVTLKNRYCSTDKKLEEAEKIYAARNEPRPLDETLKKIFDRVPTNPNSPHPAVENIIKRASRLNGNQI